MNDNIPVINLGDEEYHALRNLLTTPKRYKNSITIEWEIGNNPKEGDVVRVENQNKFDHFYVIIKTIATVRTKTDYKGDSIKITTFYPIISNKKIWVRYPNTPSALCCPICGDEIEVYTDASDEEIESGMYLTGDRVRCVDELCADYDMWVGSEGYDAVVRYE